MKYILTVLLLLFLVAFGYSEAYTSLWERTLSSRCLLVGLNHSETSVVVTTASDSTYILDALSGEIKQILAGSGAFGISLDDEYLFHFSSKDSTFVKVSISTAKVAQVMQKDGKYVMSALSCVSPDCHYAAAAYKPSGVTDKYGWRVWDLNTGAVILDKQYATDSKKLKVVGFTDPRFVCGENKIMFGVDKGYYVSDDSTLYTHNYIVYDLNTGDSLESYPFSTQLFAFNSDCSAYGVVSKVQEKDGITLYARATNEILARMQVPSSATFNTIVFSRDNQYMIANSNDSLLFICRTANGEKVYSPGLGGCFGLCVNKKLTQIPLISYKNVVALIPPATLSTITDHASLDKNVYPNPANGLVRISLPPKEGVLPLFKAYYSSGKSTALPLYSQNNSDYYVDVRLLESGSYTLAVQQGASAVYYKLIINR